jgi:nucleotide-binding universal stress UspA family protein
MPGSSVVPAAGETGTRLLRPIVVGVDGSPVSVAALRWATRQAELTGCPLVALTSWHVPMPGAELVALATDVAGAAREVLDSTLVEALGPGRAATVDARVSADRPAEALLQTADGAELIVIGPDTHAALAEFPHGPVAEWVITYSSCPVAVIHARSGPPVGHIVVGVDGSPAARDALAWALRQARLTGSSLDAVFAWDWAPRYAVFPYGPPDDVFESSARRELDDELARLTREDRSLVTPRVMRGHPARVLVHAAADADLLVVGRRGAGGALRHLMGSVSSKCVTHAEVPVVVTH